MATMASCRQSDHILLLFPQHTYTSYRRTLVAARSLISDVLWCHHLRQVSAVH